MACGNHSYNMRITAAMGLEMIGDDAQLRIGNPANPLARVQRMENYPYNMFMCIVNPINAYMVNQNVGADMEAMNDPPVFTTGAADVLLPNMPRQSAWHACHHHELKRTKSRNIYICDGCKMRGFGSRYSCKQCSFDLHKKCMFPRNSTFKFVYRLPGECPSSCRDCYRYCEACAKPTQGFAYYCDDNGITFHPRCFSLPHRLCIDDIIEFELCEKLSSKCSWCKKARLRGTVTGNSGWAYVSDCREYNFHVFCMNEWLMERKSTNGDTM